MDSTRHHQLMPNREPSPAPAQPAAAPQEATGDSESDVPAVSSVLLTGDRSSVTDYYDDEEEDAESACGGGNGVRGATSTDDGDGSDGYDVAVEGDEAEVDSWMAVPWWRRTRTIEDAAKHDDGGYCAPAAEGGAVAGAGGHGAESNRLFWEACIAHGY